MEQAVQTVVDHRHHMSATPLLHEFIAEHRANILATCIAKMKNGSERSHANVDELKGGFALFVDEVVRALQQDAGLPVSSPLPKGRSEAAGQVGRTRQLGGFAISKLATDLGSLSETVGELADKEHLAFGAREYQVFNQCVDKAIAAALEQFTTQSREQDERRETERMGFLAHELRNALSSARMSFAILMRGQVGVAGRTREILNRSLGRLEALVNQALLEVQLRSGKAVER